MPWMQARQHVDRPSLLDRLAAKNSVSAGQYSPQDGHCFSSPSSVTAFSGDLDRVCIVDIHNSSITNVTKGRQGSCEGQSDKKIWTGRLSSPEKSHSLPPLERYCTGVSWQRHRSSIIGVLSDAQRFRCAQRSPQYPVRHRCTLLLARSGPRCDVVHKSLWSL